jgi:hypothetical protein
VRGSFRFVSRGDEASKDVISFTLADGKARVTGPATLFYSTGEMTLDPQEIVSHPKIALAPVQDGGALRGIFRQRVF